MFATFVHDVLTAIQAHRPVAWCRLVETRGSTPQKAGATMLVYEDGSQAGTLGGGCVEAEVKRRALAVIASDLPEIARFQLDSDYGWDDGLICGGRMLVLIQPIRANAATSQTSPTTSPKTPPNADAVGYFTRFAELLEAGEGITEIVRFESSRDEPVPAQWIVDEAGTVIAALNGEANLPPQAVESLRPLSLRPRPYAAQGLSYLPNLSRCRLIIVGGGHVGQAVAALAADLDFDVWVVDDRSEYVTEPRFPKAQRRITGDFAAILPALEITPDTYCLIVTRGHNHDELALSHLIDRGARYVGMIGSRRKIRLIFDDLLDAGVSPTAIDSVFAPVGIDIGSQTVPEIAVSICAELVAHRNCDGAVPRRMIADSGTATDSERAADCPGS